MAALPPRHLSVTPSCLLCSSLQGWGPYSPSQGWTLAHGCLGLEAEGAWQPQPGDLGLQVPAPSFP